MLHAASMLTGLWIIWLLVAGGWRTNADLLISVVAALACLLFAWRAGGVSGAISRLPAALTRAASRMGAVLGGALATLRAAIAADVTLNPALVRVKSRARAQEERAAFGAMISATPGMAVVDADPDGLLVHVLNEDAVDADDLGRLEARVIGRRGGDRE